MTNEVALYRAIERLQASADSLCDSDWTQSDLNGLASEVGEALKIVIEALYAVKEHMEHRQ